MTWVMAVLISTSLFAVVTVFDKRLASDLFPSAGAFNAAFGLLQGVIALVYFAAVVPTVGFDGGDGAPWAVASGLLWALGLFLFFHGLSLEEASRAAPIQQVGPIFAAVVAVLFLGETLAPAQWAAVVVVILGAVLVSARPEQGLFRLARGRAFFILLGGSFSVGMAFIASEQATREMNVWGIQAIRSAAMCAGVLALAMRPRTLRELRSVGRSPSAWASLILAEGILAPVAALMFVVALSLGPVSSVSAVSASRSMFVLLLGVALSTRYLRLLDERIDPRTIALKAAAVSLIIAGVATLSLG